MMRDVYFNRFRPQIPSFVTPTNVSTICSFDEQIWLATSEIDSIQPKRFHDIIICSYEAKVQILASFMKIVRRPHFSDV
jgi:hypothetical protein